MSEIWKDIEEYTGLSAAEIYAEAGKLKKDREPKTGAEYPQCSMNPDQVKMHDKVCDILEDLGWNDYDISTGSSALWILLAILEKESK